MIFGDFGSRTVACQEYERRFDIRQKETRSNKNESFRMVCRAARGSTCTPSLRPHLPSIYPALTGPLTANPPALLKQFPTPPPFPSCDPFFFGS